VFDVLVVPSSQSTTQFVPLTVAPDFGWVMKSFNGDVVAFETLTGRLAVATRPAWSRTVTVSVCVPFPTVLVFQAKLADEPTTVCVATVLPSTATVNVLEEPVGLVTCAETVVVPLTVVPAAGVVIETDMAGGCRRPTIHRSGPWTDCPVPSKKNQLVSKPLGAAISYQVIDPTMVLLHSACAVEGLSRAAVGDAMHTG
jgi:hypothetical protein